MRVSSRALRLTISLLIVMTAASLTFIPPIKQPESYHDFADKRTILGVPNFCDVASNVLFLVGGVYGLLVLYDIGVDVGPAKISWLMFFTSGIAVSIGSSYYHLDPTTDTLIWDRLPMTVAFMSIVLILTAERISEYWSATLFIPLQVLGIGSVILWVISGDLRLYIMVQTAPVVMTPVVLYIYKGIYPRSNYMLVTVLCYGVAKILEMYDKEVFYSLGGWISGHTLKHLVAGYGMAWLSAMLKVRTQRDKTQ